jgi:hypothetical protein
MTDVMTLDRHHQRIPSIRASHTFLEILTYKMPGTYRSGKLKSIFFQKDARVVVLGVIFGRSMSYPLGLKAKEWRIKRATTSILKDFHFVTSVFLTGSYFRVKRFNLQSALGTHFC